MNRYMIVIPAKNRSFMLMLDDPLDMDPRKDKTRFMRI